MISASIVTFENGNKAVKACKSITENSLRYPVLLYVFDNASSDDTATLVSCVEGVHLIRNSENIGFGAAHNLVLKENTGKYHFVVNPDITFSCDLLSDMTDYMENHPEVVMMMPQVINTDGTVQELPKEIPTFKRLFLGRLSQKTREEYVRHGKIPEGASEIDFCSGSFFCIRTEIFRKLGGFDQRYFMYLEDADLTLRAKKYGKVIINTDFSVVHEWERTSSKSLKYLLIHTCSALKFLLRKGKILNENNNNRV